jgi:CRISPR-associated endonuclease Cas3-HD
LPRPYDRDPASRPTLEPTRAWLREHPGGLDMTPAAERDLLDRAHGAADTAWVADMGRRLAARAAPIGEAIQSGLYSHAGGLIRRVDQRTVLVHGAPEAVADPWHSSGFPLAVGTLHGLLRTGARDAAADEDEEGDLTSPRLPAVPWRLKVPVWDEDGSERRAGQPSRWDPAGAVDLSRAPLFALNPSLASYDPWLGLGLLDGVPVAPEQWARPVPRAPRPRYGPYQRETLAEHTERMLAVLEQAAPLWPTVGAIAGLVERWCAWPPGTLERLARAAAVLHDAGKLTARWQAAARSYQTAGGQPYLPWLVHTDERAGVPLSAGPHALAGAAASTAIGEAFDREANAWRTGEGSTRWDDEVLPSRVLFTAIATHHGAQPAAGTVSVGADDLLPADARDHLGQLLRSAGLPDTLPALRAGTPLHDHLVVSQAIDHAGNDAEYLALTLVSRLLRLADGWSQERPAAEDRPGGPQGR